MALAAGPHIIPVLQSMNHLQEFLHNIQELMKFRRYQIKVLNVNIDWHSAGDLQPYTFEVCDVPSTVCMLI